MARVPKTSSDRRPLGQDGAEPLPPDPSKPLVRITAGSPDHKILIRALDWLLTQPDLTQPDTNSCETDRKRRR